MEHQQIILGLAGLIAAAIIMYRFRHYLRPRNNGESLAEFAKRAQASRAAYIEAKMAMHGPKSAAITVNLINIVMLIGLMWLLTHVHTVRWIAVAYVVIGAYLAPRLIATPPGWGILTTMDRLLWRIDYSWFWPLLAIRYIRNLKGV